MSSYRFLSTEEVKAVHEATLQILEDIGISAKSEQFKAVLTSNGCKIHGDRIKFPPTVVEKFVKKAPSKFNLYRRDSDPPLQLGEQKAYSQICSGTPHILDLQSGERRSYLLQDIVDMTRLGQALPNIDIISCGVPTDIDEHIYMVTEIATMLKNTTKPVRLPVESPAEFPYIFELLALLAGGMDQFKQKPFLFLEVSPLSPLDFADMPAEAIVRLAEEGIPIGIIPCNMMGATGPMTIIGAVAQQNAEVVAGIVAAQMVNPGLPVIMSPRVTFIDMKTGAGMWAAPEVGLAAGCSAEIAHYYNLPISISGFSVAAKLPDQQSGYERCFNSLCATLAGCDIFGAAGSLDNALIASYVQLVLDDEIASLARCITRNIEVTPDTLAVDVIAEVIRSNSSFLEQKHTRKYLRAGELWSPPVGDRSTYAKWSEKAESIDQKAKSIAVSLLEEQEAIIDPAVEQEIEKIIAAAGSK
jgi:trimethylamine---corrinoid protein Co-methyltransferase